jgi:hypothetical protein
MFASEDFLIEVFSKSKNLENLIGKYNVTRYVYEKLTE